MFLILIVNYDDVLIVYDVNDDVFKVKKREIIFL